MLSPEDIRRRALTCYPDFLRSIVNGSTFFPLPIRFGKPSATEDFEKLRAEITALNKANLGCHIEWIEVNSRRWGKQRLPERVEFVDEVSYLRALGKTKEVARFRENLTLTRERCPSLKLIMETRPLDVIEFADVWAGLLEVCCYFQLHPRPNLYARELPLSVDTKFVERYQAILSRLLTVILLPHAITEADRFEERFGLRFDEPQIRFRLLDESLETTLSIPFSDLTLPLSKFRELGWQELRVIVSENKMTFLTLPNFSQAIGVWGCGNAAALLHNVHWLDGCEIFYWGDLDTQGLEILSRLRSIFPNTRSLMMDAETLEQFNLLCSTGTRTNNLPPANLTTSEMKAWSVIQIKNSRLEQERIPADFARKTILDAK
jgi:hypothetical protein